MTTYSDTSDVLHYFYTKQKLIMQRWPDSIEKGAEFAMPTAK